MVPLDDFLLNNNYNMKNDTRNNIGSLPTAVIGDTGAAGRKSQPDDASLFNAVSSMGDDTRMGSSSMYTSISTLMDDGTAMNYYMDGDGCHTVSSVYQRSVLSASASVYTDIDSTKGAYPGGTSTVAEADDDCWDQRTHDDLLASDRTLGSFVPMTSVVANDNGGNGDGDDVNDDDEEEDDGDPLTSATLSDERLNDIRNMQSVTKKDESSADQIKSSGISRRGQNRVADIDGVDDNQPGSVRLTLNGLQEHDMKEACNTGNGIFSGVGVRIDEQSKDRISSSGPIDVDEGIPEDDCIGRKMMMMKLDKEESGLLGRIDEDEISILSTKPFSAGSGVSPKKTQEMLRREREKEREERLKRTIMESKEKKRALKLKEAELLRQRNMQNEVQLRKEREAEAQQRLKKGDNNSQGSNSMGSTGGSGYGQDTHCKNISDSSKAMNDIPSYCVVCMEGERSHLAVPCMHFSFCEFCVKDMQKREVNKCPVCNTENVTFSRVFF